MWDVLGTIKHSPGGVITNNCSQTMFKIFENYLNNLDSSTKSTENELCQRFLSRLLISSLD